MKSGFGQGVLERESREDMNKSFPVAALTAVFILVEKKRWWISRSFCSSAGFSVDSAGGLGKADASCG